MWKGPVGGMERAEKSGDRWDENKKTPAKAPGETKQPPIMNIGIKL